MRIVACTFLACASVWAQSGGSITTTVSQTLTLPPGQVQFYIDVTVPVSTPLDKVIQSLGGLGLLPSDLVGQSTPVSYLNPVNPGGPSVSPPAMTTLSFSITRGLDAQKALTDMLNALRAAPPLNTTVDFRAILSPNQTDIQETGRTVLSSLIADARRKAQTLASAANLTLGAVLSMSDTSGGAGIAVYDPYPSSSNFRITYSLIVRFAAQ